jgi:hypothetical protein
MEIDKDMIGDIAHSLGMVGEFTHVEQIGEADKNGNITVRVSFSGADFLKTLQPKKSQLPAGNDWYFQNE